MKTRGPGMLAVRRLGMMAVAVLPASRADAQQTPSAMLGLDSLLNTPVSTASKYDQDVRLVAGSVTVVTAEDIRRFGYRTLTDVLQSMAGVYVSNQRSLESFGVRGFGRPTDYNDRILLLINGHAYTEGIWGMALLGESLAINLQGVERVELVRGPSSGLYGTGAMFAVINIITKDGRQIGGVQVDVEAGNLGRKSVGVVAGSGLGQRGSVSISAMHEATHGNTDLFYPEFNTPANNNGIAHNLDGITRTAVQVAGNVGSFTLRAGNSYRLRSDPTGSYGVRFNAPDQLVDKFRFVELANLSELSPSQRLATRVYYDDIRYDGRYPVGPSGFFRQSAVNRVLGGEVSLRWDLAARDRLTVGAEYRRYLESSVVSPDDTTFHLGHPFSVGSVYLQNEFQLLANLTLMAGLRHDANQIAGGATTPRAAILYDPWQGTTLKVMYGMAYRAPSFWEIAFKSPTISGSLGPEKLQMFEAIWLQRLSKDFSVSASVYHYRVHHLIDAIQLYEYVNREEIRARGFELTLDARPTPATRGYLNYTYQHAQAGGIRLSNSPSHMLKGGLGADLVPELSAAAEFRIESSRLTPQGTTTHGYMVANTNLTFRPAGARSRDGGLFAGLEFGLRIENLFNTRYSDPGSIEHLQASIPQNGRTFIARLTSRF